MEEGDTEVSLSLLHFLHETPYTQKTKTSQKG